MRKAELSLNRQMEELYCVSIDGQRYSDTNSKDIGRMRNMLTHAMTNSLTERQYSCLSMYYFDSMTMKEIGKTLGLHQSTVSRHVHAARVKLEKLKALVD